MKENKMTTKEKVNKAFRELRKAGYWAKQNCNEDFLPNPCDITNAVYYLDYQGRESWGEDGELKGKLYLQWSGNSKEIVRILNSLELDVWHDGREFSTIVINP